MMNMSSTNGSKPKVIIAGGGLAGIACAKRLIDAGFMVELIEAEPQLGGRTASWRDNDNVEIESGVHTFFGIYSHLTRLLTEVGIELDQIIRWHTAVGILQPGAKLNLFALDPVRNPLGLLAGLLGNNSLVGPLEKLTIGLTFVNGLLRQNQYEPRTLARLARDGGINHRTYERLLRQMARGLAFLEPEELSANVLLTLLTHALFNPVNLRTGTFRGGMTEVMIKPMADWIIRHGGTIRVDTPLQAIRLEGRGAPGLGEISGFELENGELLTGDLYVSALPLEIFKPMIPTSLQGFPYFSDILALETVPATAVQLWFNKRFVNRQEFIILTKSPLVVFQDESHITFPMAGSRISGQITDRATDNYSDEQLINLALTELHRFIPASLNATLQKAVVVRHQAIAIKPGVEQHRPSQASPVSNFFLAGDYTRQDWFTTMEGATISGEMAAAKIVQQWNRQHSTATNAVSSLDTVIPPAMPAYETLDRLVRL